MFGIEYKIFSLNSVFTGSQKIISFIMINGKKYFAYIYFKYTEIDINGWISLEDDKALMAFTTHYKDT